MGADALKKTQSSPLDKSIEMSNLISVKWSRDAELMVHM